MTEADKVLWAQMFQDRPIPLAVLENSHAEIMAQIVVHPVDFGEEIRLAERRRWGLGLAISLMGTVFIFLVFLWFKSDIVYQVLSVLLVKLFGLPYASDLQLIGQRVLQDMLHLRELKTELDLLWGVVSWPIFGVMSVIVISRSSDSVRNGKPSI
ncbi:MAG TPA: hypothetical protein VN456_15315 [Desulfosporosinus sp.]|nr:hypothetical protein [Desulfosporosinus sp.]